MNRIHLYRSQTLVRARQSDQFLLYVTKHRETLPAGTAKNSMSHQKMFVSTVFKTVFHLIFNAKIMSILEITFGISFICNDLDLTDILSKTENALSTAIYQSEVRQLEKSIKFTVRQFASTCLSVKTPQTTQIALNEHQNQPLQLQTTSCPQTHHTKHLSTRYGPAHETLVLVAYSQKFYLIC